jgi:hypothetical protein
MEAGGLSQTQVDVANEAAGAGPLDVEAGPIAKRVRVAYSAVWLGLALLLFLVPKNPGNGYSGNIFGELVALTVILGIGFLASLVWIHNPRRFMLLLGVVIVVGGLWSSQLLAMAGGAATIVGSRRSSLDGALRGDGAESAFLSMPLVILALLGAALYDLAFTRTF